MNDTFHRWSDLNGLNIEDVINLIITNGTVGSIGCDSWILDDIGPADQKLRVLDFGCGVGRNIFEFSENKNWHIIGYDNELMLKTASEYCRVKFKKDVSEYKNITLSSDWECINGLRFDCVYSTLVFQHIFENDLNKYLQDIKTMANSMVVMSRRYNDDIDDCGKFKNTWQILENNGFHPCDAEYKGYFVEGYPEDHLTVCYKW